MIDPRALLLAPWAMRDWLADALRAWQHLQEGGIVVVTNAPDAQPAIVSLVQLDGDIVTSVHDGLFTRCPDHEAQQRLLRAHLAALQTCVRPLVPPDAVLLQIAALGAAGFTALGVAGDVVQWFVAGLPWRALLERAALTQLVASAPLALRGALRPMLFWYLRHLARSVAAQWRTASVDAARARSAA